MSRIFCIAGFSLERVSIDYGLECTLQSADQWVNLRFTSARLNDIKMIQVDDLNSLTNLLQFLHSEIKELRIDAESVLRLTFEGGGEIRVYPNDEFESWELATSDNKRIVCMPGGDIAEWN